MSSKKKENVSCISIVCHDEKGTCQVLMPKDSATGGKRKICGGPSQRADNQNGWIKWRAYGWPLNGEVGKEDTFRTLPLLLWHRDLVGLQLAKAWDCINDDPR